MATVFERTRTYFPVVDEEKFAANPFGRCYLPPTDLLNKSGGNIRGYCYSTSATGFATGAEAELVAKSANGETGRRHVVVEFSITKRVKKIS